MNSKIPPYDTGKIKIGVYYTPPLRADYTYEERMLQRMLLPTVTPAWNRPMFYVYLLALVLLIALASCAGGPGT